LCSYLVEFVVMLHDIKNIFHLIIIFQCLFFSFYLLAQKHKRRLSNLILVAFLLSKAVTEIGGVLVHFQALKNLAIVNFPHIFYIEYPFSYAYVPFLFLYIFSFTKKDFKFRKVYLLHFIPFLFFLVLITLKFHIKSADSLRTILQTDSLFSLMESRVFDFVQYVQFFVYAVASLIILRNYRMKIKNVFSTIEHINLSWLNFVVFGFISWKSLRFINYILWITTESSIVMYLYIAAEIIFLIFVSLMFLKGLRQPVILTGYEDNQYKQKYEKTSLSKAMKETYKNKLLQYMENQKLYLDSTLCINELAEKVSIPPHHLSQVINTCFNQNFYDFINSFRINESKRLLSEQDSVKKTVLEILYATGFNSKSVFNTAFKKHTGMTPTQFKKLRNS
jgi:AraC-like DNA-binding protein